LAAQDALAKNDQETALKELTNSINAGPDPWAYYQRAKIYTEKGEDEKAKADCQAGLALDPEHVELKWLQGELAKPSQQRFQGRNKEPPMIK
jgi:Tfp pilus assembly protein PilF